MANQKEIKITKCTFKPEFVGQHVSYVSISNVKPKYVTHKELKVILKKELAPFVTHDELKLELINLETRLTATINTTINDAVAKQPAWFDEAMKNALVPITNRLDNLVEKNNLVE